MTSAPESAAQSSVSPWLWLAFFVMVFVVMALDLGVFHRTSRQMRLREALVWVCVWVALALLFNFGILFWKGPRSGIQFLTGYLVELALSVDNLFVFLVIFSYFSVPPEHQYRILFWGILGAVLTRIPFILLGCALFQRFVWVIYIFGAFLVYTGVKLLREEPDIHPEKNIVLRLARRFLPMTEAFHGDRFFVKRVEVEGYGTGEGGKGRQALASATRKKQGLWLATPLFLVLLVVDATDIVFAVDSVPAVLAVTPDSFLATTSNIFAILGLRAMYFVLLSFLDKFHYLKYGLSLVLVFIGAKMLAQEIIHLRELPSLLVVAGLLGGSIILSLLFPPKKVPLALEEDTGSTEDN